ncbi:MAG: hypothetical protein U0Q16_08055 [Bryobacteraceae bacterium]
MGSATAILDLVARARQRALFNLVGQQLTVGVIAALAGAILLLLVGTQILDWYWLVVLFLAGAGISAWRTMSLLPSSYSVAQIIDRRLDLKDAISTAYHFLTGEVKASSDLVAAQRSFAENLAGSIQPAAAVPLQAPQYLLPATALLAVAAGMFGIRYGISGSIDLRKPIVQGVADFFIPGSDKTVAKNDRAKKSPLDQALAIPVEQQDLIKPDLDKAPDGALNTIDVPDTTQGEKESVQGHNKVKAPAEKAAEEGQAGDEGNQDATGEQAKQGKGESPGNQGEQAQNKEGAKPGNPPENASVMDKMKDAFANLMAKLKIPNTPGQGKQQTNNKQQGAGQKGGQMQEGGSGQKGEKGEGQPQGKGSPSDDPNADGQQGEQQSQSGEGRTNDKTAQGGNPNDPKSGMGKQDGSKDLKNAEQSAAMGKISEIFGKRAQNITGEVMVEVSSSKQQGLRTQYTQKDAAHREAGGEIHRDEIPQELQHYVQQYFETVRKGESTKPAQSEAKQ